MPHDDTENQLRASARQAESQAHRQSAAIFEEGRSKRGTGGFGVEIEHLPVHNGDDTAVSYYEENGVETLLKRIAPYYDKEKEYWENGHLVGLGREGIAVSLEPGGQVECSLGILKTPQELLTLYRSFRRDIDPVLDELGFRLVNYGYQPKSGFADARSTRRTVTTP